MRTFCFSLSKENYFKENKQLVQDLMIPPPSIYIHMCSLYTYTNTYMPRFRPSGLFSLVPTPGFTSEYSTCSVCVCVCEYAHTYTYIHPHPCQPIERILTSPLSFLVSKIPLFVSNKCPDDDCFYYHSWRNNVVIAFGALSF